jgi:hypothetical protein
LERESPVFEVKTELVHCRCIFFHFVRLKFQGQELETEGVVERALELETQVYHQLVL